MIIPAVANKADVGFDTIWLGITKDHYSMGVINDEWMGSEGRLAKKFNAVAPCDWHGYAISFDVQPMTGAGGAGFFLCFKRTESAASPSKVISGWHGFLWASSFGLWPHACPYRG